MTSSREGTLSPYNPTLQCIAVGRRRAILNYVGERGGSVAQEELVTHIDRTEQGTPHSKATEVQGTRIVLIHSHLPALEAAGLITWDRDAVSVETTAHPALKDPRFHQLLKLEVKGVDETLTHLSHERRRRLLMILRDTQEVMTLTALARELLRGEIDETDPDATAVDGVIASLYHTHLPALDTDGLVEYDYETGHAEYTEHPALKAIFTIIYEPKESLVDRLDRLLKSLEISYPKANDPTSNQYGWPGFWGESAHE